MDCKRFNVAFRPEQTDYGIFFENLFHAWNTILKNWTQQRWSYENYL